MGILCNVQQVTGRNNINDLSSSRFCGGVIFSMSPNTVSIFSLLKPTFSSLIHTFSNAHATECNTMITQHIRKASQRSGDLPVLT